MGSLIETSDPAPAARVPVGTSTADALECLQACPLFASVPLTSLARVLGAMEARTFEAGDALYSAGEQAETLFLITRGTVSLTLPSGREMPLAAPHCGEEALGGAPRRLCGARAVTHVAAWCIPADGLSDITATHKRLVTDALLALSQSLSDERLLASTGTRPSAPSPSTLDLKARIGWICAVLLPLIAGFATFIAGASVPIALFAAIMSVTVTMWVFSLVDEFIPPLVALVAILFTGLAPPLVALGGFANPTLMTLLGVFALSAVMAGSGLTYRLMLRLLRAIPDRPAWQQTALMLGGYALSPITPSGNNRLALMLPLYRDMREGLGLPRGGNAATALMAATFSGAMLFSPMMATSKSSNLVAVGLLPAQTQEQFMGLYWLVAAAVAALTCTALNALALRFIVPAENPAPLDKARLEAQLALLGPLTSQERVALAGFVTFLVGSATVSWHHVQSAYISGAALVALLVSGVFSKKEFKQALDWPMLFFLLGVDGLVQVMRYLGVDTALGTLANTWLHLGDGLGTFILVALAVVLVVRIALPVTAGMLVSAVMLLPVAQAQGVHPWICVFLTAMFSDIWFAPYQSSVWMQAVSAGLDKDIDTRAFLRHNMAMNLARVVAAYASIPWWKWLGLT